MRFEPMTKEMSCSDCSFMIRSENDDELIEFVQKHAREAHDTDMAADDIRAAWKTV
jgi:predicted small metal-binding protein